MDKKLTDFIIEQYDTGKTELTDPTSLVTKSSIMTFVRGAIAWETYRTGDTTPVLMWMKEWEKMFQEL